MKVQNIRVWPDTAQTGIPLAGSKIYIVPLTGSSVSGMQTMETLTALGEREGTFPTFGTLKADGSLDLPITGDFAPMIFAMGIGSPLTNTPLTASVWTATTLYTVGDIVNHSDGLHSLICQVAGTSGATEPDLSAYTTAFLGRGVEVTDGTTVWRIEPLKRKYTYKTGACLPPFSMEIERGDGCDTDPAAKQYEKFIGLRVGQVPLTFAGGDLTLLKSSIPVSGVKVEGTLTNDAYTSVSTLAGLTVIPLLMNSYSKDQCTMIVGGQASTALNLTQFALTVNNNISSEDLIGGNESYVSIGALDAKGDVGGFIKKGVGLTYLKKLAKHTGFRAEINIQNPNTGDSIKIVIPQSVGGYPKFEDVTTADTKFTSEIAATKGGVENTTIYVEVVSSIPYTF